VTEPAYPPPPWLLRGEAAILAVPVRTADARRFAIPAGARVLSASGWTLGGVLLARYDETATLPYHELIVFSALALVGGRPAFVVSHIFVDSPASRRGGREIWGLPKELATFSWSPKDVAVEQDGRALVRARLRRRAPRLPVPLVAPVAGNRGGVTVRAAGTGWLRAAPALATVEVPAASPFAALGLDGARAGLAGDRLDLRFPGARALARSR